MTAVAREARVEAQAKVNLLLRILAREASGYHQIETVFQRITLSDSVTVRATTGGRSLDVRGGDATGPMEQNLAWRAAVAYQESVGFPGGFEIELEKRIPVGGGLGGGSADAGGVLRALNALNPASLSTDDLLRLGGSLGADVPFLTQDRTTLALAWGRGDRMVLLPPLPASAAWLLVPPVAVQTAAAYRWVDEADRPPSQSAITVAALTSWAGIAGMAGNDFEPAVGAHVPVIARLLATLRESSVRAVLGPSAVVVMSGSGSTIAVIAGARPGHDLGPPPASGGVRILETETATFVEPVVLTH